MPKKHKKNPVKRINKQPHKVKNKQSFTKEKKSFSERFNSLSIVWQRLIATVLIITAAITAAGGFTLDKLNQVQYSDGTRTSSFPVSTEDDEDIVTMEELASLDLWEDDPSLPDGEIYKDKNVVNIILLGTDERGEDFSENARSDTMMIVSINKKANTVKLVSIERATGVPILSGEYKGQYDWLTHCFRYGGASLVIKEIQSCFLVDLSGYVRTNIYSFIRLIDAVGGVDVSLTAEEVDYINNYEDYEYAAGHVQEMGIADYVQTVKVGENHLYGPTAMLYARCRQLDNDFGRMSRQRIVIEAVFEQIKDLSLSELNSLLNTLLPMVQTNLSKGQMATLLMQVPSMTDATFDTMVVPKTGTYGRMYGMEGRSLFAADFETNAAEIKSFLYTY